MFLVFGAWLRQATSGRWGKPRMHWRPPRPSPCGSPPPTSSVPAAAADPPLPRWGAGLGGLAQDRPEGCAEPRAESSVPRPAGSAAPEALAAQEPRRDRRITRLAETGSGAWVLLWLGVLRKKGMYLPSLLERRVLSEKRSEMLVCTWGWTRTAHGLGYPDSTRASPVRFCPLPFQSPV